MKTKKPTGPITYTQTSGADVFPWLRWWLAAFVVGLVSGLVYGPYF